MDSTTAFQNPSLMGVNGTQNQMSEDTAKMLFDSSESNGQKLDLANEKLTEVVNGITALVEEVKSMKEEIKSIKGITSSTPDQVTEEVISNDDMPTIPEGIVETPELPVQPEMNQEEITVVPEVPAIEETAPEIQTEAANPETNEEMISIESLLGNIPTEENTVVPNVGEPVQETVATPVAEFPAMPELPTINIEEPAVSLETPTMAVPETPVAPVVPIAEVPATPVEVPTMVTPDVSTTPVTPVAEVPTVSVETPVMVTPEVPVTPVNEVPIAPVAQTTGNVIPLNINITEASGDGKQRSVVMNEQNHVNLQNIKADDKVLTLAA